MKTIVGIRTGVGKKSNKPYQWVYWTEESPYVSGLITGETYIDMSTGVCPPLAIGDQFEAYAAPGTHQITKVEVIPRNK